MLATLWLASAAYALCFVYSPTSSSDLSGSLGSRLNELKQKVVAENPQEYGVAVPRKKLPTPKDVSSHPSPPHEMQSFLFLYLCYFININIKLPNGNVL